MERSHAYIPFYSDCVHGMPDDYTPARTCKVYRERLLKAKVDRNIASSTNLPRCLPRVLRAG